MKTPIWLALFLAFFAVLSFATSPAHDPTDRGICSDHNRHWKPARIDARVIAIKKVAQGEAPNGRVVVCSTNDQTSDMVASFISWDPDTARTEALVIGFDAGLLASAPINVLRAIAAHETAHIKLRHRGYCSQLYEDGDVDGHTACEHEADSEVAHILGQSCLMSQALHYVRGEFANDTYQKVVDDRIRLLDDKEHCHRVRP